MKAIKRLIFALINIFVFAAGFLVGKSKKYILIGGWSGEAFADNSKHLFLYLNRFNPGYKKIVFYTRNKDIYTDLLSKGYFCVFGHSPKAVFYHLKCRYHVCDHDPCADLLAFFSAGSIKIYLSHGFGYKLLGNEQRPNSYRKPTWLNILTTRGCWLNASFSVTSDLIKQGIIKCYNTNDKHIFFASQIRDFSLINTPKDSHTSFNVFYLPTFRDDGAPNPFLSMNIRRLNDFFRANNIAFYAKPHRFEINKWPKTNLSNIKILDPNSDLYDMTIDFDLIISDYSSGLYDYLLLNKMTINYAFDLAHYLEKDRHLMKNYADTCPMAIVSDFNELLNLIISIKENPASYKNAYRNQYAKIKTELFGESDCLNFSALLNRIRP